MTLKTIVNALRDDSDGVSFTFSSFLRAKKSDNYYYYNSLKGDNYRKNNTEKNPLTNIQLIKRKQRN